MCCIDVDMCCNDVVCCFDNRMADSGFLIDCFGGNEADICLCEETANVGTTEVISTFVEKSTRVLEAEISGVTG